MQFRLNTGFTMPDVVLPACPTEGDFIRYRDEFTYEVKGVSWTFGRSETDPPLIPIVHILPAEIPAFEGDFTEQRITAFMPRKGDGIGHKDNHTSIVNFLVWVIKDPLDPNSSRIQYSLGQHMEQHPGEVLVKEAGDRHGHIMAAMTGGNLS